MSAKNTEVIDLVSSDDESQEKDRKVSSRETDDDNPVAFSASERKRPSIETTSQFTCKRSKSIHIHDSNKDSSPLAFNVNIDRSDLDNGYITQKFSMPTSLHTMHIFTNQPCNTSIYRDVIHIQQKDKWSCGFRNLQMVLSYILSSVARSKSYAQHTLYNQHISETNENVGIKLPSIRQIQSSMEHMWKEGYDQKGAKHYRSKLVGKRSYVGAVEVCTYLTFQRVDSTVVQFLSCHESRSLLGKFVIRYFESRFRDRHCMLLNEVGSRILVNDIMEEIERDGDPVQQNKDDKSSFEQDRGGSCVPSIAPIYLQWEGHSVTIIGVEILNDHSFNLLLLDPNRKTMKDVVTILPSTKLLNRDHQIIVTSTRTLSDDERDERKLSENSSVVTAANSAVLATQISMGAM